ncbi:MAG: SIR2 family protein [Proteobacteria bacterium]|nr:SIR2 family protein [Pseudomonadota bacterium]
MTVWTYWSENPASASNLRLLVPGRGWVSYADKLDAESKVAERGSQEQVDSALINVLSASNFLTLTGAGVSLSARNPNGKPQAPSMSDLWNGVRDAVGDEPFKDVCAKFPKAKLDDNIEKLLSVCKVYLELNETAGDEDKDVGAVKAFVQAAEACILTRVDFANRDTTLTAHETFVRKIGRRGFRKSRAKIFTTNYDLTIEEAARRLRFTIIDGFSHTLDQVYDRQHFDYDIVRREASKDAPDYISNVFHLYKLHGSTDWRRTDSDIVRSRDNDVGKPVLIYPRSSKYQEAFEPPYLDMMGAFQASLREPDTSILIVGFGFKDDHISRPIISALESNLSLRLVICDPGFILTENDLRGADQVPPAHAIPVIAHENAFIERIKSLVTAGDQRIHLINGRFEDLALALPDLIGETDRERHVERIKNLRGQAG